jgi:hypothetical protein
VTTCFLLAGKYYLPGDPSHFTAWANLIAFGGSTTSDMAQRDVGYPLLLIIGGYLSDVLTKIVNGHPNSDIVQLLPSAY